MKYSVLAMLIITITLACSNETETKTDTDDGVEKIRNMKGFDLFVWDSAGKTYYTLLPGTNRDKDSAEIYDVSKAKEWSEMEKTINRIDTGEYVFVRPLRTTIAATDKLKTYLIERKLIVQ